MSRSVTDRALCDVFLPLPFHVQEASGHSIPVPVGAGDERAADVLHRDSRGDRGAHHRHLDVHVDHLGCLANPHHAKRSAALRLVLLTAEKDVRVMLDELWLSAYRRTAKQLYLLNIIVGSWMFTCWVS